MKLTHNGSKIFTIGGIALMAGIATAPVLGPAVVTGVSAKIIWGLVALASTAVIATPEN